MIMQLSTLTPSPRRNCPFPCSYLGKDAIDGIPRFSIKMVQMSVDVIGGPKLSITCGSRSRHTACKLQAVWTPHDIILTSIIIDTFDGSSIKGPTQPQTQIFRQSISSESIFKPLNYTDKPTPTNLIPRSSVSTTTKSPTQYVFLPPDRCPPRGHPPDPPHNCLIGTTRRLLDLDPAPEVGNRDGQGCPEDSRPRRQRQARRRHRHWK